MDKNQVANLLDEIASLLELKEGSNPFEVRAYQKAARAVNGLDGDIEQLTRQVKIKSVPGLGWTTIKRIEEAVETGHIALYNDLVETTHPVMIESKRGPG